MLLSDNRLLINPFELRRLKTRRTLTDRTLFLEDHAELMPPKMVAEMYLATAVSNHCGKIVVKRRRWNYEFDVKALNEGIKRVWGRRQGVIINEVESKMSGNWHDTVRGLFQVPRSFNVRETVKFKEDKNGSDS